MVSINFGETRVFVMVTIAVVTFELASRARECELEKRFESQLETSAARGDWLRGVTFAVRDDATLILK